MNRARITSVTIISLVFLGGCSAGPQTPRIASGDASQATLVDNEIYAVQTANRLWVGDALGMRVLARHDADVALALDLGHGGTNTFRVPGLAEATSYATVNDSDEK